MELQKRQDDNYLKKNLRDNSIVTNEFKLVFGSIALNIGIREPLELRDFDNIFTFLQRNYGGLTLHQINEAFDYYSAQKLDFKDSHFNSFDQVFVGKVLKSYEEKKAKERVKPKIYDIEQRVESTFDEKKSHFEWLLNEIYLDQSKRHGKKGEFPEILLCNWSDCYDYLVSEGMIIEKKGSELTKRYKEIERQIVKDNSKSKNRYKNVIKINAGNRPMSFYRFEVMEYFKQNREQLIF